MSTRDDCPDCEGYGGGVAHTCRAPDPRDAAIARLTSENEAMRAEINALRAKVDEERKLVCERRERMFAGGNDAVGMVFTSMRTALDRIAQLEPVPKTCWHGEPVARKESEGR
jgi:hypothetical protein